jgi:hypothetical protein
MEGTGASTTTNCTACGRVIGIDSRYCPYCGVENISDLGGLFPPKTHSLPIAGGILIIVSAIFSFVTIWLAHDVGSLDWYRGYMFLSVAKMSDAFLVLYALMAIGSILGALSSLFRKSFAYALLGGLLAAAGLCPLIGIAGLLFVAVSEDQFQTRLYDSGGIQPVGASARPGDDKIGWRR